MKQLKTHGLFTLLFVMLCGLFFSLQSIAVEVDLTEKLVERNELNRLTQDPLVKPYLFDNQVQKRLSRWLSHSENRFYVVECQIKLRPYFKSARVLASLCYLMRQDKLDLRQRAYKIALRYMLEVKLALREAMEDERYPKGYQQEALRYHGEFQRMWNAAQKGELEKCFQPAYRFQYPGQVEQSTILPFHFVTQCLREQFKLLNYNLGYLPNHPGHLIGETGWISGNAVTYLHWNDVDESRMVETLREQYQRLQKEYPVDTDKPGNSKGNVESFLTRNWDQEFTEAQGFIPLERHPVWSQKKGIFKELLDGINSARESLFVDIFFLGGSMGAQLAKQMIRRAEAVPGLKILILRDQWNHFGHLKEMLPVYNYLLAYSLKNPQKLVILPAHILEHRSALPSFLHSLVSDQFLQQTGIQDHLVLYGRGVSDHSKVFVVDGKSKLPTAFVGSKNLTDTSGGFCYDEVGKTQGPAAAVVLDDYYLDMRAALKHVNIQDKPYFVSTYKDDYVTHLAKNGWSKSLYQPGQKREQMIANILLPFDLLERDAEMMPRAAQPSVKVTAAGNAVIRTGMTNVDSTRSNLVDQVVQAIFFAQKQIYIKDQFVFDRNVVLALIRAKEAKPALDIKILLEPLAVTNPQGMPNLLYLDKMLEVGIEIKWMITHGMKPVVDGTIKQMTPDQIHHLHEIAQEYHMKTLSVDGRLVIVGSANKDQSTLYGAFREAQLEIVDPTATLVHDQALLAHWNDPSLSVAFTGYDFDVKMKGPNGKPLTADEFIVYVRNILSILFDWTTIN